MQLAKRQKNGNLTLELIGAPAALEDAIRWLKGLEGLELEVLENV